MKILTSSDWHLGNMFHGNDRLPEHRHFLQWLLEQIKNQQPDALLVAGDVFDNGNPSAAAQTAYYEFLADATSVCPQMHIVITAGNHDSAPRLEAPRPMLSRHNVEIRGNVQRLWQLVDGEGRWVNNYDDLIIPIKNTTGEEVVVLAVPYLRMDVVQNASYSEGVNRFLQELTRRARTLHPGKPLLMMAHMYAKGAEIADRDASEKIVIGGQEEVNMEGWTDHPDYLTCGHIHKRQHIWNTDWARYTGSVLPMSFAEKDYLHGVDMITFSDKGNVKVEFLQYHPQHQLRILPENDEELSPKKLMKLVNAELRDRNADGALSEAFDYVIIKAKIDKLDNDEIKQLEELVGSKDAVLCKIQKIIPALDLTTITGGQNIVSIDDILNRDPMETLKETYAVIHKTEMSEHQITMLQELLNGITDEASD